MFLETQPITVRSGAILENLANHSLLSMGQLEVAGAKVLSKGRLIGWRFRIGPDEYFVAGEDVDSSESWSIH